MRNNSDSNKTASSEKYMLKPKKKKLLYFLADKCRIDLFKFKGRKKKHYSAYRE